MKKVELYPKRGHVFTKFKIVEITGGRRSQKITRPYFQLGDVVMSKRLSFGLRSEQKVLHQFIQVVNIDGIFGERSHDPTRKKAEFVIEEIEVESRGGSMDDPDSKPPIVHVYARRLKQGRYDPQGEMVGFSVTDDRKPEGVHKDTILLREEVTIVREMRRIITFVDVTSQP